ncbi:DUF2147 domain-containing protein [Hephaestia sp. GCM10023244]|uniref:DUF2147 domain-containing protein n=1 Tax=unclassified Hephaestia TaxID=2631281 RepID=UPI002076E99D|nr:DUF2147 domain-containing protein [Hephaestia sp. MAHUQ-44]MCM8729881.1 DUF2147 domain-containing protein [Hephaestia sp. MAHUQ-44]
MICSMRLVWSIALAAMSPVAASRPPVPDPPTGLWINPHGSVKVMTAPCAGKLCGWIVWASPQATMDAAAVGAPKLIGLELLRDYHPAGPHLWRGTVYVPDMARSFASRITQLDANRMKIDGCILAGLVCKSQIWRRA